MRSTITNKEHQRSDKSISNAPTYVSVDPYNEIEKALGRQVRSLRQRQQLTAKMLARRASISVALLSKLEHGSVSPSLQTVSQLAKALGVPVPSLFQQTFSKNSASFVPAGAGLKVERAGSTMGQFYELLGLPIEGDVQIEPYLITIDKHTRPNTTFQHEGVELIHVIEGSMIYCHGKSRYTVKQGDSLFFDARQIHGPESFLNIPTRFLSVISYRRS